MCLQFHRYISAVQSLWGELFISAGGDTRGERRWTRPFKGAGGFRGGRAGRVVPLSKDARAFTARRADTGLGAGWEGPGRAEPLWLLLSSPVGAGAQAVPCSLRPQVSCGCRVWQEFSPAMVWLKPWASAGLSLAGTDPCFPALVRRMRESTDSRPRPATPAAH